MGSNAAAKPKVAALLFLLCIGLAQAKNAWAPAPDDCGSDSGSITCELKCDLVGCIAGCIVGADPICFLTCLADNISCQSTCSIIPFPPSPPPPAPPAPPPMA